MSNQKYSNLDKLKTPELKKLAKEIIKNEGDNKERIKKLALGLIKTGGWGKTFVGSQLLLFNKDQVSNKEFEQILYRLAIDSSWEVRETAAGLLKRLLLLDFDHWLSVMKKMVRDKDSSIRRAAVVGSMQTKLNDAQAEKMAQFVYGPLLTDENQYVRKNLGLFALNDFLRLHPESAFKFFDKWIKSHQPRAVWNVLNAFSIPRLKSRKYGAWLNEARNYLKITEKIDDKIVQGAVKSLKRRLENV